MDISCIIIFGLLGFGAIFIITYAIRSHLRYKRIFRYAYMDQQKDWEDWDQQKNDYRN